MVRLRDRVITKRENKKNLKRELEMEKNYVKDFWKNEVADRKVGKGMDAATCSSLLSKSLNRIRQIEEWLSDER